LTRPKFIAGNWKMHGSLRESEWLVKRIVERTAAWPEVDVAVCPPCLYIPLAASLARGSRVKVGAQNMYVATHGAFTGEVAGPMLKEVGCDLVILGHSERRMLFGETDALVNQKVHAALSCGLDIILCVGETLREREMGATHSVVERQVAAGLQGVTSDQMEHITIAYEPVWAIGTGRVATPDQAVEVHRWIRRQLEEKHGVATVEKVRIQYGGSVTPENCESLLRCPEIDGALVGGASLKADAFMHIVEVAQECTRSSW